MKRQKLKQRKGRKRIFVSIIIPVYNEERVIADCIRSLQKQSYKNFEIIVVDDGSSDRTVEIVKSFEGFGVRLLRQKHKGPGVARNLGARYAKGKILSFPDADMTFHRDYLKNLIKPIIQGEAIGTEERKQIASNKDKIWSKCWGSYFRIDEKTRYGKIFRAILKSEFERMGGFDASLGYADDSTFYKKFRVSSVWVDNAICYHKNPETLREVYRQSIWIGSSTDDWWIDIPLINILVVLGLVLFFPLLLIPLSLAKCYRNRNFKILLAMIIFIATRYLGTIVGLLRRIIWKRNVR